jgi:LytS/YehU family sensor histidine kinase
VLRQVGRLLEMSVSDDGQGVPACEVERIFFAPGPRVHALSLLRRRMEGLFGHSFQLEVWSDVGQGTTVTLRIPLRKQFDRTEGSLETVRPEAGQLAPH